MNAGHLQTAISAIGLTGALFAMTAPEARSDTLDTAGQPPYERCGYCHEVDGNSRMEGFPRIAGQTVDYLVKQLRDFRTGRRASTMRATAELLTDAEIAEVARYFNGQSPLAAGANPSVLDRKVAERLHRAGDSKRNIPACGSCHGPDAEGRDGNPRLAGQHAEYLKAQLLDFKHGKRANDSDGVMRAAVSSATENEIHALAHYFASFSKP